MTSKQPAAGTPPPAERDSSLNATLSALRANTKGRPRPLLRGILLGLAGALAAAATRYDALAKPGGRSVFWLPLVIAIGAVIVAGFAAGAVLYWPAKKELNEAERADAEASKAVEQAKRADRILARRDEILAVLALLAEGQSELVSAASEKRSEYLGRFKERAVEGTVRVTRLLQESEDVEVRGMFIEYDESPRAGEPQLIRGPMNGQRPLIDMRLEGDDDFSRAVLKFMAQKSPQFYVGDPNETHPDIQRLRFNDGADHFLRMKVTSRLRAYGLLCVDTWGTATLSREDIAPVLAIAKLLAAGLSAAEGLGAVATPATERLQQPEITAPPSTPISGTRPEREVP